MRKHVAILSFLAVTALVGFQNCSDVNFGTNSSVQSKSESPGTQQAQAEPCESICDPDAEFCAAQCKKENQPGEKESGDPTSACAALDAKVAALNEMAAGSTIQNVRGNLVLKSAGLARIHDTLGNLRILGVGENAKIASLSGSAGNFLICNMDIEKIEGLQLGNIVVVGGNIGSIDGFRGNITLIGGQVTGDVKNSLGRILVK